MKPPLKKEALYSLLADFEKQIEYNSPKPYPRGVVDWVGIEKLWFAGERTVIIAQKYNISISAITRHVKRFGWKRPKVRRAYNVEKWNKVRKDFEEGDMPIHDIIIKYGCSWGSIMLQKKKDGWKERAHPYNFKEAVSTPRLKAMEKDYKNGKMSIRHICETFGIGRREINRKARKFGWVRRFPTKSGAQLQNINRIGGLRTQIEQLKKELSEEKKKNGRR